MARSTSTNFTGGLDFTVATDATDLFKKEDVQVLAQAVDQHDHSSGKGLAPVIPDGSVTAPKIAYHAVGTFQIDDLAVSTAKIIDGNVTAPKMSADIIDGIFSFANTLHETNTNYTVSGAIMYVTCISAGLTVTLPRADQTPRPITILAIAGDVLVSSLGGTVAGGSFIGGVIVNARVASGEAITFKSDIANWRAISKYTIHA